MTPREARDGAACHRVSALRQARFLGAALVLLFVGAAAGASQPSAATQPRGLLKFFQGVDTDKDGYVCTSIFWRSVLPILTAPRRRRVIEPEEARRFIGESVGGKRDRRSFCLRHHAKMRLAPPRRQRVRLRQRAHHRGGAVDEDGGRRGCGQHHQPLGAGLRAALADGAPPGLNRRPGSLAAGVPWEGALRKGGHSGAAQPTETACCPSHLQVERVSDWLRYGVKLPAYVKTFKDNAISARG